jgi:hypothetical protein
MCKKYTDTLFEPKCGEAIKIANCNFSIGFFMIQYFDIYFVA